ncbi:MAG TPA: hypothetical protein VMU21_06725 [Thermodesulfovibrionales bacterium]|nr:hypothetical protein [Thermodesulfovibrionales bacterium]
MMTSKSGLRFGHLVEEGLLTEKEINLAYDASMARGVNLERILLQEFGVPRLSLLEALSRHYDCPYIEYDERLPVPTEVFEGLNSDVLSRSLWFPLIKEEGAVTIAANDPRSPRVSEEARAHFPEVRLEFRVALASDIQWYIRDFLHAKPKFLIGIERTGLAFWRNTMAHWRTRLACYRTDLAKGRTSLAILRWGLGLIAFSDVLLRTRKDLFMITYAYWAMMLAGLTFSIFGFAKYLQVRRSRISPPKHHTLVEVTAATTMFLENYHLEGASAQKRTKGTMLARLSDCLPNYCTILNPVPASKERTHLARERNVLAAQRTIAACYRTMYSRARTGLAFIRTGVAFFSLGLGFLEYFLFGLFSIIDSSLMIAGLLMVADGVLWYMPARKEQSELPRCPVPQ